MESGCNHSLVQRCVDFQAQVVLFPHQMLLTSRQGITRVIEEVRYGLALQGSALIAQVQKLFSLIEISASRDTAWSCEAPQVAASGSGSPGTRWAFVEIGSADAFLKFVNRQLLIARPCWHATLTCACFSENGLITDLLSVTPSLP